MSDRYDPLLRRSAEIAPDYLNGLESERFPSSGCSCLCLDGVFPDYRCGDTASDLGDGDYSLDEASLAILFVAPLIPWGYIDISRLSLSYGQESGGN